MMLQFELALALLHLLSISRGEVYDVTTIYDLSSVPDEYDVSSGTLQEVAGRVHVRTNALGLPISDGMDNLLDTKDADKLNLTCDVSGNETCSWSYGSDWKIAGGALKDIKPDKIYNVNNKLISIGFKTLEKNVHNEEVFIHITKSGPDKQKDVLLEFSKYSSVIKLYYRCGVTSSVYGYHYVITLKNKNDLFNIHCYTSYHNINYFQFGQNDFISFNFVDGSFNFYNKFNLVSSLNNEFTSDDELLFKVYFGPESNLLKPEFAVPVLSSESNGSEIISPLIMTKDNIICLTLVIECPVNSREAVLLLLAEDLIRTQHSLISVKNVQEGLNVIHQCVNIENVLRPFKLILKNLMNIGIVRISSYNPEGEEVWPLGPLDYNSLRLSYDSKWASSKLQIYQPDVPGAIYEASNNISLTNNCQNGGLMTVEGCACLPGYSGAECEIACGPNSFGLDCGGMCSIESKMCQNLLICNFITGCHCASGYEGTTCFDNCRSGSYGNDCEQNCGNCLSTCDIYTGKCQLCKLGYVPPYCKKVYVYYASNPELSSMDYGSITVKFNPWNTAGVGTPELYQIQYKEQGDFDWSISINKNIEVSDEHFDDNEVEEHIEGLKSGHLYEVRVVLMDANFNKYDGELIQTSQIVTKCDIPETYDYNMKTESTTSTIFLSWLYTNKTEHWCPVESYEVSMKKGWEWKKSHISVNYFSLNDLLPNVTVKFAVRAKTTGGYAPSSEINVSTKQKGNQGVRDLRVVVSHSTSAQISWSPPWGVDKQLIYNITYKCVKQPACLPGCVNATEGVLIQDKTSVTINPLLPFAQYLVTITPENGPESNIYVGTKIIVPTEIPKPSAQGTLRSNTSLTVFWDPVPVCSGFLQGYKYQLLKELDNNKILDSRFTKNTNATFHNLTASTEYRVRVFVTTTAGCNPDAFLEIKSSTSATVPEAVRNLTVYKRGRNMLGIRWAAPRSTYGSLKAFTISYSLGTESFSNIEEPTPCVPWPDMYCHTIQGLRANRKYTISVSARNSEVAEDGEKSSVNAVTKESPPMVPEGLKLTNSSSTTISVQWHYPNLANGVIRSFLISVEETEQFDQDNCCQIFPLVEIPVQEEQLSFKSEVSGLHPASTYFVSVSAKTVGMGPSQSLVVHTKPPHLPFSILPRLQSNSKASWLPQELPVQLTNYSSDIYTSLIKTHLLLIVDQTGTSQGNDSGIFNPQLNLLLHNLIGKPFFFYQEYNQDNLDVTLTSTSDLDSEWGACPSPSPLKIKDNYQLVAAQISEYSNEFTADLRYFSETVTFDI